MVVSHQLDPQGDGVLILVEILLEKIHNDFFIFNSKAAHKPSIACSSISTFSVSILLRSFLINSSTLM